MTIKRILARYLFGLSIPQQYVCLGLENCRPLLQVRFRVDGAVAFKGDHLLLGYKPVVIAIPDNYEDAEKLGMEFHYSNASAMSRPLAKLHLQKVNMLNNISLYRAIHGQHHFINTFHRLTNEIRSTFQKSAPGNVDLPGNLHDQVRIAYSIPRKVSLITVFDGERLNIFPTDLHGHLSADKYISSLRIGGKACQQVERIGRIVLCEVACESFTECYELGKNHMREMQSIEHFNLSNLHSEKFLFPLPPNVIKYFELEVVGCVDVGIHRVFAYRIANQAQVSTGQTLAHIHQYYAQWRENNKLATHYLLR